MEDESSESGTKFIPTLCFVKRGVAKARPDKVVLTPQELSQIIKDTKSELQSEEEQDSDGNESDDDSEESDEAMDTSDSGSRSPTDEYNFKQYEEEVGTQTVSIGNIAEIDENAAVDDEDDSEAEDDLIKPTDNLLIVGSVSYDASVLEVWVLNEEEESFYAHHDFMLSRFPLCIEWLNHDPGTDRGGNLCAIGNMDPIISIWDLDIQDSFEPTFKLGSKGSRKKNKAKYGHTDAVLDLSWNTHFPHILSSGSADKTVILWDLDEGLPHTTINVFKERVQSISFHPKDPQNLLTGCSDGIVRLFDCRDPQSIKTTFTKWEINAEVEKVVWNPSDPNFFINGACNGRLYYADIRQPKKFLWTTQGHKEEISGIAFNSEIKNLLTTASPDGFCKIWKFNDSEIKEVYKHDFSLKRIHCMAQNPDDPFTLAFGGENPLMFRVFNIKNFEAVRVAFDLEHTE